MSRKLTRLRPWYADLPSPWPSSAVSLIKDDMQARRSARVDKLLATAGVEKRAPKPRPTLDGESVGWASHGRATKL